jgi:hypothetical protein
MSRSDSTNGLVTVPPYNRASQVFLDCNPFKIMIILLNPWCGVVVGPSSVTPWEAFCIYFASTTAVCWPKAIR